MRIVKAKDAPQRPLNMMVYGPPGCGKTTFAATAPGVVIIDYEFKAEKSLRQSFPDTPIIFPTRSDSIRDIVDYCLAEKYQTICIDTVDRLFDVLLQQLLVRIRARRPQIQHWGEIMDEIKREIVRLQAANCNLILLSHEAESKVTDPITDKTIVNIRPNIPTNLRSQVPAIVDIVGYMGKAKVERGMNQIWIRGPEKCNWYCKSAWSHLPEAVWPDFQKLYAAINPAPPAPIAGAPAGPETIAPVGSSAADAKKLLAVLSEYHAKIVGDPGFLEFEDDLRQVLESRYGVPVTSELTDEQRLELYTVCTEDVSQLARLRNVRDSIITIWRNRHANAGS